MAEATSRVRIGPLVSSIGYRNPHLVADIARTVDHVSNGRAILGLGSGWFERDYREYGYEFKTAPTRLRDLADALPIINARLARLNPPPVRGRLPLMIGGFGEKVTLRLVAEHADIWNAIADPGECARLNGVLDQWCRDIGRNPADIERSTLLIDAAEAARADDYLAVGMTHLIVAADGPGAGLEPLRQIVAWRDRQPSESVGRPLLRA